jgi:outer membrane lipopolysaccharide assembly protein LptE/RlpB
MKKNSLNILRLAVLLLTATLALSSCGFAARNLAKQVSDLTKRAANIERQAAELQEMAGEIEEKVAALSPKNRQKYQEELVRLGFEAPD